MELGPGVSWSRVSKVCSALDKLQVLVSLVLQDLPTLAIPPTYAARTFTRHELTSAKDPLQIFTWPRTQHFTFTYLRVVTWCRVTKRYEVALPRALFWLKDFELVRSSPTHTTATFTFLKLPGAELPNDLRWGLACPAS